MQVMYNSKTDLLYIRFDDKKQNLENRRISENVVLDIGEDGKIIGIEILDASQSVELSQILPINIDLVA